MLAGVGACCGDSTQSAAVGSGTWHVTLPHCTLRSTAAPACASRAWCWLGTPSACATRPGRAMTNPWFGSGATPALTRSGRGKSAVPTATTFPSTSRLTLTGVLPPSSCGSTAQPLTDSAVAPHCGWQPDPAPTMLSSEPRIASAATLGAARTANSSSSGSNGPPVCSALACTIHSLRCARHRTCAQCASTQACSAQPGCSNQCRMVKQRWHDSGINHWDSEYRVGPRAEGTVAPPVTGTSTRTWYRQVLELLMSTVDQQSRGGTGTDNRHATVPQPPPWARA